MSDLIKIKGGSGNVPDLLVRELGYSQDEKALYIGTSEGNEKLCSADQEERIKTLEKELKDIKTRLNTLEEGSELNG